MAYCKNENKLKEYLSKQDDTNRVSPKTKSNTRSASDDKNIRRG